MAIRDAASEDILFQMFVAFGQGTGALRVKRETVRAFSDLFGPATPDFVATWETDAVQMLERVRAVGRLAAHVATERGDTVVIPDDLEAAYGPVKRTSRTPLCP